MADAEFTGDFACLRKIPRPLRLSCPLLWGLLDIDTAAPSIFLSRQMRSGRGAGSGDSIDDLKRQIDELQKRLDKLRDKDKT